MIFFYIINSRIPRIIEQEDVERFISNFEELHSNYSVQESESCYEWIDEVPANNEFFDISIIETYTGNSIPSLEDAKNSYCFAYSKAISINNILNSGYIDSNFPVIYIIIVFGIGWYIFSIKLIRGRALDHLFVVVLLMLSLVFPFYVSSLIFNFLSNVDEYIERIVYLIILLVFTISVVIDIVTIDRNKTYSRIGAASLTLLPYLLLTSAFSIDLFLSSSFKLPGGIIFGLVAILTILLVPLFKAQYLKLLSLPMDDWNLLK